MKMYCNLSKNQALPMALRVSSQPKCSNPFHTSKIQSFSNGVYPKPSLNPIKANFAAPLCVFSHKTHITLQLLEPTKVLSCFSRFCVEFGLPKGQSRGIRSFSSMHNNSSQGSSFIRARRSLPWLADNKTSDSKRKEKIVTSKVSSKSSWEISAEKFVPKSSTSTSSLSNEKSRSSRRDSGEDWRKPRFESDDRVEGGDDDGGDDDEVINDFRWNKIKTRVGKAMNVRGGFEKSEGQRWNRQESWGRKTYREAHESSVPKMIGEGVYGVGPVLAALTSGRREFYALYVQEGLELNKNNKKRKDKKGFEKVLKIAESISLTIKEISKHDLNMVVDNRPHQGLVLDSSPLEMVNIKELDPVCDNDQNTGLLWVALDEVTDPQNLGAIIRSAYYFGASGVVLCAKNSAPLSGVVSKASAGSLELMEMRSCKNMMQFLTLSSQNGWRVLGGSVSSRAVPLREIVLGQPTILVLGSEGTGLRPLVERSCTQLVRIPGNIPLDLSLTRSEDNEEAKVNIEDQSSSEEFQSFMAVESLNVSVAAGVLLHHLIGDNYMRNNHQIDNP